MEKITRLNWFKKVFGGVAAICAWPLAGKVKENPFLTAKQRREIDRTFTSLPTYRTVQRHPTLGTDLGDKFVVSIIRPFLTVTQVEIDTPGARIRNMIPIWLEEIPEDISQLDLMYRMIYGKPLPNQTLLNWCELETKTFEPYTTYKAHMVGLLNLVLSRQLPKGGGGEVVLYEIREFGQRWAGVYADSEDAAWQFITQYDLFRNVHTFNAIAERAGYPYRLH